MIVLTSDFEIDGVALAGAVSIGCEAMVDARVGHRDALHDEAPVAHDHAAVLVVAQRRSLETNLFRVVNHEPTQAQGHGINNDRLM